MCQSADTKSNFQWTVLKTEYVMAKADSVTIETKAPYQLQLRVARMNAGCPVCKMTYESILLFSLSLKIQHGQPFYVTGV